MLKWLFITIFFLLAKNSFAQTDTSFWFAAPEITNDNSSPHSDRPIILRMTAFNSAATVTISQPANAGFSNIVVSIAANTSLSVDLTSKIDLIESNPANLVLNTGLLISSTSPITAYYEEASPSNPEMFVLKGRNALGTNFFIPAQNIMSNWDFYALPPVIPSSSFDIVATEDNTQINITPANNIVGHPAGISFTITLNKGQTYSATATGRNPADHLMGSVVTSNKPIAITIKDDSIGGNGYSGCLDLAGDQVVPLTLIGTKYIALPGFLNNPIGKPSDHLFILATEDNTSININGNLKSVINKGVTYRDSSYSQVQYIETSKPTYVLHLTGFGCEVGHAVLPSIECTGSQKVAFTRSNIDNLYMNILVPAGYEDKFKLNGNATIITAAQFTTVPFSGGLWKYAQVLVSTTQLPAGNAAIVENSGIEFHLSILNGDASNGARYGYFSDFNKLKVTAASNAINDSICAKSDLKFFTNYNNALGIHFNWTGPNGFSDTIPNPILPNIATNGSGVYNLTATKFSCTAVNIPLNIVVNPTPNAALTSNAPICTGNNLTLNASYAGGNFSWTGPNGFTSASATNSIGNITLAANGFYKVVTTANNCVASDSIKIIVNETPLAKISIINNNTCLGQSIQLSNNNSVVNSTYNWLHPNGSLSANQNIALNNVAFSDTGRYILTVSTASCSAKDTAYVTVRPTPKLQFITLAEVCSNAAPFNLTALELLGMGGSGIFSGLGVASSGLFTPSIVGNAIANIRYTFTANNGCVAFSDQSITVNPAPTITLDDEKYIKFGGSVILDAKITGNYSSLIWQDATNTLSSTTIENPWAMPINETLYKIVVSTNKNCVATDSVWVKIATDLFIPNAFSPNNDGKNDKWEVEDKAKILYLKANIFDRYGKLVKTLFGNKIAWDGLYNGQPLPMATYYYVLTITNGNLSENRGGWIQLLK